MQVVDHLHVNVIQRTINIQPRSLRRSLHLLADAVMNVSALLILRFLRKHKVYPWSLVVKNLTLLSSPWPTTNDQDERPVLLGFTSLRSYQPSSSISRPRTVHPYSCRDLADATSAFPPRLARPADDRFP